MWDAVGGDLWNAVAVKSRHFGVWGLRACAATMKRACGRGAKRYCICLLLAAGLKSRVEQQSMYAVELLLLLCGLYLLLLEHKV